MSRRNHLDEPGSVVDTGEEQESDRGWKTSGREDGLRVTGGGGDGKGVGVGLSVLEGDAASGGDGLAVVDEAVVISEAAEDGGVDGTGGAEPAAGEVDVGDGATRDADVDDVDGVRRDAAGQRRCGCLMKHDVLRRAHVPNTVRPEFCSSRLRCSAASSCTPTNNG